ncbi:MAG: hypothetical protein PHW92_01860 [Lutibacter sp.]|nr:hypothetical protein [Lutibacter sp.]
MLSPRYDINPTETKAGLQLNISENDNSLDLNSVLEVSIYFKFENEEAFNIINEVKEAVSN